MTPELVMAMVLAAGTPAPHPKAVTVATVDVPIVWLNDYAAATSAAAASGHPLLIVCSTKPCTHCVTIARMLAEPATVATFRSGNFVVCKLDERSNRKLMASIARSLYDGPEPSLLYPTLVIAGPDGTVWRHTAGSFESGDSLRRWIASAQAAGPTAAAVGRDFGGERRLPVAAAVATTRTATVMGHSHRCPFDGTVWSHTDASFGNRNAHACPACGRITWRVHQSGVPVAVRSAGPS